MNILAAEQRADVLATTKLLPARDVTYTLFVEEAEDEEEQSDDEDEGKSKGDKKEDKEVVKDKDDGETKAVSGSDIYEGDLVTLRVSLARPGVPKSKTALPALTPLFPAQVQEGIWLILTGRPDGGKEGTAMIHGIEKIADNHKIAGEGRKDTTNCHTVEHDIRFMAPPQAGSFSMQLYIFSDTYMGLDELIDIDFEVKPAAELPVYEPHPEDLELENEPTLFEQVIVDLARAHHDALDLVICLQRGVRIAVLRIIP